MRRTHDVAVVAALQHCDANIGWCYMKMKQLRSNYKKSSTMFLIDKLYDRTVKAYGRII